MTHLTFNALIISGACSLEDPQPKFFPTEYMALPTVEDMKQYGFSPLRPELAGQIQEGDIIVVGKNFGCINIITEYPYFSSKLFHDILPLSIIKCFTLPVP